MSSSNDTTRIETGDLLIETNAEGQIEIHNLADGESVTLGASGFSASAIETGEMATGTKPWADVLSYGAVGDGSTDDTQAFKDAIAAAPYVYVPYTSAGYRITDQLSLDATVLFSLSTNTTLHVDLSGSTATTALFLTSQASSWATPSAVRNIKVRNERRDWDLTDAYSGIEMDAIHEAATHGVEIDGFEYGLHINSTDSNGVAYGTHDRNRIMDCVEAIRLETSNGGWTNENTFSNVRIDLTSDKRTERDSLAETVWGVNFINRTTNNINSNKFYSVAIENTTAGVRCTGRYNTFVGLRCEFMAGADDIGLVFEHPVSDYGAPRYNFVFGLWGPTSGDGSASRIVARNADGTESNTLEGNKAIARDAVFNTGAINLHEAGYRSISVWYDETNRDFVFEGDFAGVVARLDEETGNLWIAGGASQPQRGAPSASELDAGERMAYVSDGSDSHSAGDLVSARNDAGTIVSQVIAAASNDA